MRDFASGQDTIALDNEVMTALGADGDFGATDGRFHAAAGATGGADANDRVVYNTSTGQLYYDADGSGSGAAQLVGTLSGAPGLAASDIAVI
jgi:Ca2+-binding RTX toxin-like protein